MGTLGAAWLPRLGDERLARLAGRGNARAFAAVYQRYHQPLYRYCRSILRDDTDAQDALQSTFTRALSALKRDRRNAPLRPWLFRIAHNESISALRRRGSGGGPDPLDEGSMPSAPSAEDEAGGRARLGMLMGDLAALPDRARNALVMRELSGLSHEDIAIALGISPGAAKQAIFEARRGLQECAEGRAMGCAEVCEAISDGDRRVLRGRRVRAHVRDCASCADFAAAMHTRQAELRALVPMLPAAASAAVLARVLHGGTAGGGAVAGGAGGGAAVAGTAGKTVGIAIGSKGFAAASVLATAAVSVGGITAVVRLSHDGRPAIVAGGSHTAVARPAVHGAWAPVPLPAAASVRAALGTTSRAHGAATLIPPARTTSTRGHRRSAESASSPGRPGPARGGSGSSAQGQSGSSAQGGSGSSAQGQAGSAARGQSVSSVHGQSGSSSPGHSGSSSSGKSGSSHGKSASAPGHTKSSSPGQSGSSSSGAASSEGGSAASNTDGNTSGASSARGNGQQTAPGQLKKTVATAQQSVTAQTNTTPGLGAANQLGTDVPGSPALTGGKAHK